MKTTLYVDIDETLVSTRKKSEIPKLLNDPEIRSSKELFRDTAKLVAALQEAKVPIFGYENELWASKLRPYSSIFLKECRKLFDKVHILTAGGRDFQRVVLRTHGILNYFDEVYSTVDSKRSALSHSPNDIFFLIDNLGFRSLGITEKLGFLGVITKNQLNKIMTGQMTDSQANALKKPLEHHFIKVEDFKGQDDDKEFPRIFPVLKERLAKAKAGNKKQELASQRRN